MNDRTADMTASNIGAGGRHTPARRLMRGLYLFGRVLFGYIVAVAAGALVSAFVDYFFPEVTLVEPGGFEEASRIISQMWVLRFTLGLVFALPYTLVGILIFRFLLPRHWASFMIVGVACPAAAILTMSISLGGALSVTPAMLRMMIVTIPAGIVATYLFGAIGFGLGFGRWRFR